MLAGAHPVEVVAARVGTVAIEVHADRAALAALRTRATVAERRQGQPSVTQASVKSLDPNDPTVA